MFSNSVRTTALLALFAGSAILSSSASAQASDSIAAQASIAIPAPGTLDNVAVTPASGARIAPTGVTRKVQMTPVALETQHSRSVGENVGRDKAMMGAGVAAVIVGLIIGNDVGTLFVVGGTLVGLVGLFRYMQ